MQSTQASPWRLEGTVATLSAAGLSIAIDRPAEGVRGVPGACGTVLGIEPVVEGSTALLLDQSTTAYVRGDDLVAQYKPTRDFPFRSEIYWRWRTSPVPGLQLIVSVETDLLDTQPELRITTQTGAATCQALAAEGDRLAANDSPETETIDAALLQLPTGERWLEMVHPSDRSEAGFSRMAEPAGDEAICWNLFAQFLEKGVIRRARLAASLLSPSDNIATASASYANFASQPPPLTA